MPTTSPLRWAKIVIILSLVFMTLLLLGKSQIPLHQSSNFILFLSNYPRSRTILFSVTAYALFIITSIPNISVSVYLLVLSKILFMICKDPSHSNNAFMLFVLLELVLVLLYRLCHICFVYWPIVVLPNFIHGLIHYTPFLQVELDNTLPNVTTLA